MVTGLLQLSSQICQFLGVGSVVTGHVLHQRHQLFHGGMLASTGAAGAGTGAAMLVAVLMMVVLVAVIMGVGVTMLMQMLMGMGMAVGMLMLVGMFVGMGHTVMGVLMGMLVGMGMGVIAAGAMVMFDMHMVCSFAFFLYYIDFIPICQ